MEEEQNLGKGNEDAIEPSSVNQKIDILENQIHLINSKLHEPDKKSWFSKNASLLLSVIALIISVGFSIYGIQKEIQKETEEEEKLQNLSKAQKASKIEELTIKLTDLAEKNTKLASENPNVNVNILSVLLNYQRLIYINEIIELEEQIDEDFPPDIYALIANELKVDGQFEKALRFYRKELESAKSANSKVVAYRDLGQIFRIRETPIFNSDSSSFYRKLSIQYSDSIYGDQRAIFKGYSYQLWAADELYFDNSKLGFQLIDSARQEYMKLPDNNNAKNYNLRMLSQMLEYEERKELFKVLFKLTGEWRSAKNSGIDSKLHFFQNGSSWVCNMEIYENSIITFNLVGSMISISDNHITFSLQGMKKMNLNEYNDRKGASSTLRLTKYKDRDDLLTATFNELNEETKSFIIVKD
ncbi:hypothetical protein [Luteirhabdus pelagi]|uniref:hypothetical protein n=1 Tax=Luteirhabdus pelagi TaxID=2792783 RepID=UPI001939B092|nr:hypothetical protein [Luteirhabdus pelagi]